MTTGFGFCPTCGTPRVAAEQKFCAGCGSAFSVLVPAAPPAPPVAAPEPEAAIPAPPAPPSWATPPAAPSAPAYPTAPAAQAAPPAPSYPPVYPGAPAPYYPGAPAPVYSGALTPAAPGKPIATVAGIKVTPKLLAIGGIALAVIVAVVYMSMSSNSGGITFAPSTFSCSSSAQVTTTIRLPSSVKGTDQLVWQLDGVPSVTSMVADNFKSQGDGSWLFTDTSSASSSCQAPNGSPLTMGTHTFRILDASGRVLAEGSRTQTP